MKQALEALEDAANILTSPMFGDAAAALRTAIAEAEKKEPVADELIRSYIGAVVADKPDEAADATKRMVDYVFATPPAETTEDSSAVQPAAQRQWVGLTEEERNDCLVEADPCECLATPEAQELMRTVEAKLKERNA